MAEFSVALGLVDFINPIIFLLMTLILITSLKNRILFLHWVCLIIGGLFSLVGGFALPTYKLLCGLGVIEFVLPDSFVIAYVTNIGLLISGIALLIASFGIFRKKNLLLILTYAVFAAVLFSLTAFDVMKMNMIAMICGVIGFYLLCSSFIGYAAREKNHLSIGLVIFSMCMSLVLAFIGMFANMGDSNNHWIAQITNIFCQSALVLSAFFLFKKGKKTP